MFGFLGLCVVAVLFFYIGLPIMLMIGQFIIMCFLFLFGGVFHLLGRMFGSSE